MDSNTLTLVLQAINTVGFPIVCCGAMFWYINQESKSHKEEIEKLTNVLNANTLALTELKDALSSRGN